MDHGIEVKINPRSNPGLIAVYDGEERLTKPVSALQMEEVLWYAEAYSEAKAEYSDEIDNE